MPITFWLKEKSLLEELWEYIVEKYFTPDMSGFQNIDFGTGQMISMRMIIVGMCIGVVVAAAVSVIDKKHLGAFVRSLIYDGCLTPESAKTLSELGYARNFAVRGSLKGGSVFARWVRCREEDEFFAEIEKKRLEFEEAEENREKKQKFKAPEFKRDCNTMHFYVPEEKKYAAEVKFDGKGANWGSFIVITLISVFLCAFLCYILPDMLMLVDNFIGVVKQG
jgi:hypothetical protein